MSLSSLSNFWQRAIAAIIGVGIIITAIFYSVHSYALLFLAIQVLTQLEFYKLVKLDDNHPLRVFGTLVGIVLNGLIFGILTNHIPTRWLFVLLPLISITFFIKLYRTDKKPFTNIGFTLLGIAYVALPFSLLHFISIYYLDTYTPWLVLGILLILWFSDTGAYLVGRRFGRRKLFEKISPKKTWEGLLGGAIFAMGVSFFISRYVGILANWQWLGIGLIIVIAGTYGDLVESQFKRSLAIKDSGSLIPGHGGFLDRFDGLLLSLPIVVSFLMIFK